MPGLLPSQINDLVKSTLSEFNKGDITEIAADQVSYTALDVFFQPKMRKRYSSGSSIKWNVLVDANENTENHGLYHEFEVEQHDGLVQAEIPWTQTTYKVMWDDAEIDMNMEPARITELLFGRWRAAITGFAEQSEANIWDPITTADTDAPRSIPYWVTKSATTGFNGTGLTGFTTDVAGLDPTTRTNWRPYTALYTDVIETDFVSTLTTALRAAGWMAPPGKKTANEHGNAKPDERMYFANNTLLGQIEHLARGRNDNLGASLMAYMGEVTVGRRPVQYAPRLDLDTTNPFYGIHTGTFKVAHLRDRWNAQVTIDRLPYQPSVGIAYITYMWNLICFNRRRNIVLATAATYPS